MFTVCLNKQAPYRGGSRKNQKWVSGTLARYGDTFYFSESPIKIIQNFNENEVTAAPLPTPKFALALHADFDKVASAAYSISGLYHHMMVLLGFVP